MYYLPVLLMYNQAYEVSADKGPKNWLIQEEPIS